MATLNVTYCQIAEMMTANWTLLVILFIKIILDSVAMFLLGIYGHCYITNRGIHPNLRALMASLIIAQFARNFLTFIRSSQMIIRAIISFITQNPCVLLTESHLCDIESVTNGTPVNVICWCFLVISAERLVASIFYKRYERQRCIVIAIVVALLPWIYQLIRSISGLAAAFAKPSTLVPYCSSMSSIDFVALLSILVPVSIVAAILAIIIYYFNRKAAIFETDVNGSDYLTRRYQRIENMEATKAVAVLCILFVSCYVTYVFGVYFISIGISSGSATKSLAKEAASYCLSIHGSVHVLIAISMSEKLRHKFISHRIIKYIIKTFTKNARNLLHYNKKIAPLADKEDYFNVYKQQWT